VIELGIQTVFREHHLSEAEIAGMATIDLKANETGLRSFCHDRNLRLIFYSSDQLKLVQVPNPCGKVRTAVDTGSVAEAAAILAANESKERSPVDPTALRTKLLVTKQIFRIDRVAGVVTLAIAQANPNAP
jgi:cobalt-precorrin 5A hydrolase/precorrin-3B C17-methyltransferase